MSDLVAMRGEGVAAREVAGEMVLLLAADSTLLVLNEVATAVWHAADGVTPLSAIARVICRDYEVDYQTAFDDVSRFAADLAGAGALTLSPAGEAR
jgi:coenzyme PQQ synthesis protein D (PqqD)